MSVQSFFSVHSYDDGSLISASVNYFNFILFLILSKCTLREIYFWILVNYRKWGLQLQFSDWLGTTHFFLVSNKWENCYYDSNLIWYNKIQKRIPHIGVSYKIIFHSIRKKTNQIIRMVMNEWWTLTQFPLFKRHKSLVK